MSKPAIDQVGPVMKFFVQCEPTPFDLIRNWQKEKFFTASNDKYNSLFDSPCFFTDLLALLVPQDISIE